MKKRYLIIFIGQFVIILLMLMYAFVQKSEADKQRKLAEMEHQRVLNMQEEVIAIELKYQELLKENLH